MATGWIFANKTYDPPAIFRHLDDQDSVLSRIFEIIGFGNRTILDVGTGDSWNDGPVHRGLALSGWKIVCVEQKESSVKELQSIYGADASVKHIGLSYPDDANVLDGLINDHLGDSRVDLLGIRLRGPDWQAWEALKHRPRVIAVQFNPSIPPNVEYVQEDGPRVNKGASLLALQMLGEERGYDLAHVGRLAIFVEKSESSKLQLGDTSLGRMWDGGTWQSRMMVAMDGTLVVAGNKRLLWNRLGVGVSAFEQEDLQPLLKSFRRLEW